MERCVTILFTQVMTSPQTQQQLDGIRLTPCRRAEERGFTVGIGRIDFCAMLNQGADGREVARPCRSMER